MKISKLKSIFVLLTGGLTGLIKYVLDLFNTQILARIPDKETGLKYIKDVQAFSVFLRTVVEIHSDDLSDSRKAALNSILAAVDELAKALEDFEINQDELDAIIEKVKDAIDAWKKAE
jgi:hypothetical protein